MRQAIRTKYLGPTNHRGARVVAKCQAGRLMVPWDYGLYVDTNHAAAALALVRKLGWPESGWHGGADSSGDGHVFVRCEDGNLVDHNDLGTDEC